MRTLAAVLILATVATTGCVTTHQIRRPASIAELQAATGELPSGVVYELANPIVPRTPAPAADFHAGTPPLVVTGRHSANLAGFKETYRGLEGVWVEQYNGPAYVGMPDVRAFDIRRRALGGVEGMAAGALLGALVGVANGYASGDDPPCMSMELLGCSFTSATRRARRRPSAACCSA